jgi:hypothetical protein
LLLWQGKTFSSLQYPISIRAPIQLILRALSQGKPKDMFQYLVLVGRTLLVISREPRSHN